MAFLSCAVAVKDGETDKTNCMQKELLNEIVFIVSELTEISREDLLSRSRRSDIIEARCLLVYILRYLGVRPYKIAKLLSIPERSVYYSITSFSVRSDQDGSMLKTWFTEAKSRLQNHCKNSVRTLS